jgi:hypothetical protein
MAMKLSDLNRRFISYCVEHRLGKTSFSVRVIYLITGLLGRFETYKNTNDFNKRGHYIPQLLLRRFGIAEAGPKKGKIYQYSFLTNLITEQSIQDVAQIKDFYIYKQKGGGHSDYVEKEIFAHFIESFGSQVIALINQSDYDPKLTIFEQNILATFISHQITRTPAFYLNIGKYLLYLYEKNLLKIEDLGTSAFMDEVIAKNKHNVTYEDIVEFIPRNSVTGDINHLGHISRLIAGHMMEDIFRHNFHFLYIPEDSNEEFVLSDNPIVFVDFSKFEVKRYVDWWSKRNDDVWIFIPLSPKKCLYLTTMRRKEGPVEKEDNDIVGLVNFGQYLNSLNYVFGKDKSKMEEQIRLYKSELIKYKTTVADPAVVFKSRK